MIAVLQFKLTCSRSNYNHQDGIWQRIGLEDAKRERRRISSPNKSRLGIILPRIRKQTSPTSFSLTSSITTMAALPAMRQLGCLRSLFNTQEAIQPQISRRFISTAYSQRPKRVPFPSNLPEQFLSQIPVRHQPQNGMRSN
jgi:hypothetical protein